MASLFNLPSSRSSKSKDKTLLNKTNQVKKPSLVIKGGGTLASKIASISNLVQTKLGKYKDRYDVIRDEPEKLHTYITSCIENNICAIDTETTGLDPMQDMIVGFSIYTPGQKAVYVPINHVSYITSFKADNQISIENCKKEFQRLLDSNTKIIMFNAPFDIRVIWNQIGVRLHCFFDCFIAARLLNENESSNKLKPLHKKYVEQDIEGTAWSFEKLFDSIPFSYVPIKDGYIYAARDAEITFELYQFQQEFLDPENEKCRLHGLVDVSNVFYDIEMKSMDAFIDMEQNGTALDFEYCNKLSKKYHNLLNDAKELVNSILSTYKVEIDNYRRTHYNSGLEDPVNIASAKQLAILLYDIFKLPSVDKRNLRGVGAEILAQLDHPLCKAIVQQRKLEKLMSTYIDKMPQIANPNDGRVHCKFKQVGANTGRTSSSDPNLQNIPSRPWKLIDGTKVDAGHDVRQMFCASPGNVLISCDYSAQEPRVTAHLSNDKKMVQAYQQGKDVYSEIAAISFDKTYEECLEFYLDENGNKTDRTNTEGKQRRTSAKSIVLGILYGRSIPSIAEQLGCETAKAQKIYEDVLNKFEGLRAFKQDSEEMARRYGYVTTIWGRKRRLPNMQLPYFEFSYKEGQVPEDFDPLSDDDNEIFSVEVPSEICAKYTKRLLNVKKYNEKVRIKDELDKMGIIVKDNSRKIEDATRQCVNSRVQGSAADLTKLAMIELYNNQELRNLGFKMLIPIHDEILAECPRENAKRCGQLMEQMMIDAAKDLIVPISCDAEYTEHWYGEPLTI